MLNPSILTPTSKSFQTAKRTTWTQGLCCNSIIISCLTCFTLFFILHRKAIIVVEYKNMYNDITNQAFVKAGRQQFSVTFSDDEGSRDVAVLEQSSSLSQTLKQTCTFSKESLHHCFPVLLSHSYHFGLLPIKLVGKLISIWTSQ